MKWTVSKKDEILQFLIEKLQLGSTTKARKLLKNDMVQINGLKVVRADQVVLPGQIVTVLSQKTLKTLRAPFEILFEDTHLLIAVKPSGILSVSRDNEISDSFFKRVTEHVLEVSHRRERVFLVHRLDQSVSGIMLFAKTAHVQKLLEENWSQNTKIYQALVEGSLQPKEGHIESWLAENQAFKVYSTTAGPHAKKAITHYRVLKEMSAYSLVEIRLETGRKNQIRVHMADKNCPIVGDLKYGAKTDPLKRIALHAFYFALTHPITQQKINVTAKLPTEFERFS